MPSGEAPELKCSNLTCSLFADSRYSARALSSLDISHCRAGTFIESKFDSCMTILIRELGGVSIEAWDRFWKRDAVMRPARCLYQSSDVTEDGLIPQDTLLLPLKSLNHLKNLMTSYLEFIHCHKVYFEFCKEVSDAGNLQTIFCTGSVGNGPIDE